MPKGFLESGIRLNTYIAQKDKWTLKELENLAIHFSTDLDQFRKSFEIGDGIYVLTNTSTQAKLSVLNRLFQLYDAEPTDLVFYLRDDGSNQDSINYHALHKQYWTYALPFIQEANKGNGAFSNVSPSKENWVSGFFGIGGFNISCVAKYSMARTDVYFGKADIAENKRAFDVLMIHKDEIEELLGTRLVWNRGDDIKSSKISVTLQGVSIENKDDWPKMAAFHAAWSRKFIDVIVPCIEEIV